MTKFLFRYLLPVTSYLLLVTCYLLIAAPALAHTLPLDANGNCPSGHIPEYEPITNTWQCIDDPSLPCREIGNTCTDYNQTYTDFCASTSQLVDYLCRPGDNRCFPQNISRSCAEVCPNGLPCSVGEKCQYEPLPNTYICVPSGGGGVTCSDNGITCIDANGTFNDDCLITGEFRNFFCSAGQCSGSVTSCPVGQTCLLGGNTCTIIGSGGCGSGPACTTPPYTTCVSNQCKAPCPDGSFCAVGTKCETIDPNNPSNVFTCVPSGGGGSTSFSLPRSPVTTILSEAGLPGAIVTLFLPAVIVILAFLAAFFIVFSGIRFIISRGNPEMVAEARSRLIYAVVGFIILLLAFAALQVVNSIFLGSSVV